MNLRDMQLPKLIQLLEKEEDQAIINMIALEITYRLYVPFSKVTFEELLVQNGYKTIERNKNKNL